MNFRHYIYILIVTVLMCSCHSHRNVVRGSEGREIKVPDEKPKISPQITDNFDNPYTQALMAEAYSWLGTPYCYGGQTKEGADCSGFVMEVYLAALDIKLPRVSRDQGEFCKKINKSELYPGDLVFFRTGSADRVSHVGIYVGDGKIIHASSSKGVVVSDLSQKYYIDHYHHSGRIPKYHELIKSKK